MKLLVAASLIFATPAMAQDCAPGAVGDLFEYGSRTQTLLNIEAAMARAQAAEGVIPQDAADEISAKANVSLVTEEDFNAEYGVVRHRMVALLNVWRRSLGPEASQYVHYGATTVDIYDTAAILQMRQSLDHIDRCLAGAIATMSAMAAEHRDTVMIGRTLGQHAQPITFGKKVSTWIGEYDRHRERLRQLQARLDRSAILKGAVGDYSGLGDKAVEVEERFARELGMAPPYPGDWHGTRDVIAEYGLLLGLIAKSHQRIGQEIFLLASTDVGEVREALPSATVGSSSMPHKRNPVAPERLIHAGRTIPRLAEILADDVVNFYERDNTSRLAPVIEEISVESARAAARLADMLEGLEVDANRMRINIDLTAGFAMSQRVAFALAQHMPREDAEALVKKVIADAMAAPMDFGTALSLNPEVSAVLDGQEIVTLLDPRAPNPSAARMIERTIEEATD